MASQQRGVQTSMGGSAYEGAIGRLSPDVRPRPVAVKPYLGEALAADLLSKVFQHLAGTVAVRLWSGPVFRVGTGSKTEASLGEREPSFVFSFRNPESVCAMVLGRDPLRLAEAYFLGDVDIEGNLFAALGLKDHLEAIKLSLPDRLNAVFMALKLRSLNKNAARQQDAALNFSDAAPAHGRSVRAHSKGENRDAIQFHYDVSNEFYELWLDRAMVYSCAYYEEPGADLEDAQQAKLEHVCRKLMLTPGERLLDVGCGWGALVIYAARHYGVQTHGITLSQKQLDVARQRVAEAGLEDRVTVELKDYRDLPGEDVYDKISSIGMFEHVGLRNLPLYFSTVHRLLRPSGLFLNHGITHEQSGWKKNVSTGFIHRYVFPDAQLDNVSNIQRVMEDVRFEISDVEALRSHYALTLRAWVRRLEQQHPRALECVNEATYRVWRLYMSACALEFESGHLGIYQILASKRGAGHARLPLTRRHLYRERLK